MSYSQQTWSSSDGRAVVATGAFAGVGAALLYVTGASRAVGVVLGCLALGAVAVGVTRLRTHRWPPRVVLYAAAVVVIVVVLFGVGTLIYALTRESTTVN